MEQVELISLEQLEVLMMVAGAEHPLATAAEVRRRWFYIREVALAAKAGNPVDAALPQVARECDSYIIRAEKILKVLDEWIAEQAKRPSQDVA